MRCFFCGSSNSKVLDSRVTDMQRSIRRRRECLNCGKRFTTYESVEVVPVLIIKKDHSRQPFDMDKLKKSVVIACEKRPVSIEKINKVCEDVEKEIYNSTSQEIESSTVGELVLRKLRYLDELAFVRYAIVFKKFDNIEQLMGYLRTC